MKRVDKSHPTELNCKKKLVMYMSNEDCRTNDKPIL